MGTASSSKHHTDVLSSVGDLEITRLDKALHSSILAWRLPWTEDPGGLQSTGSQSQARLSDFTFRLDKRFGPQFMHLGRWLCRSVFTR